GVDWIMELIGTHEEKCGYDKISGLVEKRLRKHPSAAGEISEALRYDAGIRRVVKEKTGMSDQIMDLVFGRPLEKTIPLQFGIKLERTRQG
ncbi:MAG: hypothetical protein ACOC7W_10075, partial [Desulfosalsimonas sp.]